MANEYLKNKWRLWFKSLYNNRKKDLSLQDIEGRENRLATLNNIEGEQRKQVMATVKKLVNENVFYGRPGTITEDDFVAMQDKDFKANKERYIKKRREYFTVLMQTLNISEDGATEDVFLNAFRARGHENPARLKQFFRSFNPVDGKIPLSVLIDRFVQFTTCEDSTKPDIVKSGLERHN